MCVDLVEKDASGRLVNDDKRSVRVGVAGLGVIGEGAALRLVEDERFDYAGALVRDTSKTRDGLPEEAVQTENVAELLSAKPDVVIDALPVGEAGRALIAAALGEGVSVVSANKQAIAGVLEEFHALADKTGAQLAYSASVGGGAPMVETVRRARAVGPIIEMTAILNGTVNYILTALSRGESFEAAVKQAQDAGFAEPDPTADLSGDDARAKISILCYEAFGSEINSEAIKTEALDSALARKIASAGGIFKQLARIRRDKTGAVAAKLSFEPISSDDFFAGVVDEGNALRIETQSGEIFTCADKGAGRAPTVESLFADLVRIAVAPPRNPG